MLQNDHGYITFTEILENTSEPRVFQAGGYFDTILCDFK